MLMAEPESIRMSEAPDVRHLTDPAFLTELRAQMLKFATLQLRDRTSAEDAVQEALIGALKNASSFNRRSALKTWVFAILKNKIADVIRKQCRTAEVHQTITVDDESDIDALFDRKGFWQREERPQAWLQPMDHVKSDDFWRVFEICLTRLPENQAHLFMMREFVELDSDEICEALSISTSNLHVLLYRARLRLRECLENRWFDEGEKP